METPPLATATALVKRRAPQEAEREIKHTRRCDKREVCTCMLRMESFYFHQGLMKNVARQSRRAPSTAKGKATVANVQQFEISIKDEIARFLAPVDLATLSMVSHQWRRDVETVAERGTKTFVSDESRKDKVMKAQKSKNLSWSRYLHLQMNCVHKLFVYYTGYKTGAMRRSTPQWAFGEVLVDPNEPSRAILPNSWTFHEHSPWVKRKVNGKGGEWVLLESYKFGRAPKKFVKQVSDWVGTIRLGSHLAVAFQHDEASEVTWWEAQVWYIWRADGREEPAIVYDATANTEYEVSPRDLVEHFRANPEHVMDVCATPRSRCRICTKKGLTFFQCHVEKGHPML